MQDVLFEDVDAEGFHAGDEDVNDMGVEAVGDDEGVRVRFGVEGQGAGFGAGGAFIEQGSVGDVEGGEVADEGLEIEQGFEAALGDFGLVGGVGGVPAGVFEEVSEEDRGREGIVVTEAEEGADDLVLAHDGAEALESLFLGEGVWEEEGGAGADAFGDDLVHELVEGVAAEGAEHFLGLAGRGTDVSTGEGSVTGHGGEF